MPSQANEASASSETVLSPSPTSESALLTSQTSESALSPSQTSESALSPSQTSENALSTSQTSESALSPSPASETALSTSQTSESALSPSSMVEAPHSSSGVGEQTDQAPNPDRITYFDGFYEEPLSDEIIARINGVSYHENDNISFDDLRYLNVLYVDFNGKTQTGELICNKAIAKDFIEIFKALYDASYQIEKIRLVDEYQADDDLSCADNNTSCFNYRDVAGSNNLSKHALGLAIDINPFYNPYITYPDGKERISPEGSECYADRSLNDPRLIKKDDFCYNLFIEHGFTWGGEWKTLKDYQHFQKVLN